MKISAFGHCWVLRWPWGLAVLARTDVVHVYEFDGGLVRRMTVES